MKKRIKKSKIKQETKRENKMNRLEDQNNENQVEGRNPVLEVSIW